MPSILTLKINHFWRHHLTLNGPTHGPQLTTEPGPEAFGPLISGEGRKELVSDQVSLLPDLSGEDTRNINLKLTNFHNKTRSILILIQNPV